VQTKARKIWKSLVDDDSIVIVDSNNIEPKVVEITHAQYSTKDVLNFMESQGSQGFITTKLLMMERICNKFTKIGIVHLTSTKQCDIRSFFCLVEAIDWFQ
jgi:3,4-dihydroxy-2-butanone 4-phosphate synthase